MLKPLDKNGEELIFYNYKEPLTEVKGGYGYYGVVLSTKDGSGIQCHICGNVFKNLSLHILNTHEKSVKEYKTQFQLAGLTSLVSESERQRLKMHTINWMKNMDPDKRRIMEKKRLKKLAIFWKLKGSERIQPLLTLETKNKRGTCPDQLLEKIKVVAKHLKHSPSKDEFVTYYKSQKFVHIIYKTFGSWANAKRLAGLEVYDNAFTSGKSASVRKKRYSKEELIELMKIFYEEERKPPTDTDCRRGLLPDSAVFKKVFGSMPLAREAAGIHDPVGRHVVREQHV